MSQIKYLLFTFLSFMSLLVSAQKVDTTDAEVLKMRIESYITQSSFDIERTDYLSAKKNITKALDIAIKIDNKADEAILYTKLAQMQIVMGDQENALISLTKAMNIQRSINDYANLAITYNVKGTLHASLNDHKTALDYFNSSKTKFAENDLDAMISSVTLGEAKSYIALEDYSKAKSLLENTIVLAKKYEQDKILSSALVCSAQVQTYLKNYDAALNSARDGLTIASNNKYKDIEAAAYLVMSNIYQAKNDFRTSNDFLRKYVDLNEILQKEQKDNLSLSTPGVASNFSDADYNELKTKVEEQNKENSLTKIVSILSIALITILSLLTLSLYKNNNIRLKTNNMLHKKNDELVVAKERAELASKTKANFLSTVTHELRTPLYAVTGLTNMLLDENPKPEQIQHLKSLRFSGDYLLTFINDILQVNKIEANKVELDPELFNLQTKVGNVISALNNSALDNNVIIHYEYDKELPVNYVGDNLKISQILINLIGNAIKFTKDGDIWVRLKKIDNIGDTYNIRFEIEDNGIGISKEKQENMFESFSQGSIQINRKYGGTGLGLSIVKGLIEILKGRITLKSELGKGSMFIFEIPLTYSAKSAKEKINKPSKNFNELDLTNIKILVVEDNKINQMITKKILNKMNLQCDVVDNGEEAVERVKENNYSVVLMDIHMPGISGLEATKIIRSFDKDLTIFALTAVTLEDKMHEFDEAGFNDIISKPFKQEDFEKKLYHALADNQSSAAPIE
ncbi:hypothetical protein SAMN03097699_1962 [Flavobacteriaceae bacterium MAR_2010_188]|nr:hypothetical protein SAMN03097699_1962 [Flavobacteriaceae bacterium MAR_2010_188]